MPNKPKAEPTTVCNLRIPKSAHDWLVETAAKNGVELNQLIRWSIEALRQYMAEQGGALHLPIDLQAYWTRAKTEAPIPFPESNRFNEDPPQSSTGK